MIFLSPKQYLISLLYFFLGLYFKINSGFSKNTKSTIDLLLWSLEEKGRLNLKTGI